MPTPSCDPLFSGWELTIPWREYLLLWCLPLAVGIRIFHSTWRAFAVRTGDFPDSNAKNIVPFWRALGLCFGGFNSYKEHSDLWLPFLIQMTELIVFPVLFALGNYTVIGAWIGIKTAGGWTGYKQSRTSFNRFLVVNIITLFLGYLISPLIRRIAC